MKKQKKKLNLYQKFALAMIALGLFPMLVLSTLLSNTMLASYRRSLQANYEQAAAHITSSVESMLSVYDNASQLAYQYMSSQSFPAQTDYTNYDRLRQILSGEIYAPEERNAAREQEMAQFLSYVENADNYIYATHFLADSEATGSLSFHFSLQSSFFQDEGLFREMMNYENWDKTSKKLQLIPSHQTAYFYGQQKTVFTVARNYYDLRGAVGQEKYVGTLFIDVDLQMLSLLFKKMHLDSEQEFYLINEAGDCFFSTEESCIGRNLYKENLFPETSRSMLVISAEGNDYGLKAVAAIDTRNAYRQINSLQYTMYAVLAVSVLTLVLASFYFSRRLTRPIHSMMEQMSRVENGDFDIELPVNSQDEIGILSERFNRMSRELKNYINQSYVAQIRQNQAELTALKSQIYPHFLYNTLEVIRMTALENEDRKVSEMIEALSGQMHYLIGPVQDMVPLEKELENIQSYIYLLNCRITGKILLSIQAPGSAHIQVPKLILQPIVENAYVHGIKPKNGRGSILIETTRLGERLEISVMDNGAGMDETALKRLEDLLAGQEPGIKNEYNWQSIGLKNVHDRIRFLYGEEYGIRITSTAGVGTIVSVLLPWQEWHGMQGEAKPGTKEGGEIHAKDDSRG